MERARGILVENEGNDRKPRKTVLTDTHTHTDTHKPTHTHRHIHTHTPTNTHTVLTD